MAGDIYIYGVISEYQEDNVAMYGEVNLKDVVNQIRNNHDADELMVHINSPGGDVNVGFAIHDALRATGKKVTTQIEGLCASIATVIAFAGDVRLMWQNSEFFIHNPWGGVMGDAKDVQRYADDLKKIENKLADFYASRTNLSRDEILAMMQEETSLTAESAKGMKFIDEVVTTVKAVALINNQMERKDAEELIEKTSSSILDKIKSLFDKPKALKEMTDAAGIVLIFDIDPEVDPAVGDTATAKDGDGNVTPADGTYVLPDGVSYVFVNGTLTEIMNPDNTDMTIEVEQLREQLAAKEAELSVAMGDIENMKAQLTSAREKAEEEIKALKAEIYNKLELGIGNTKPAGEPEPRKKGSFTIKRK